MTKRANINAESITYTLVHDIARQRASETALTAPDGWMALFTPPTRTLAQNAKMWSMLHDIEAQVIWYGEKLPADEWKDMFTAGLKRQKVRRGIYGGYVICGGSTRDKSIKYLSDMIELMYAFGSEKEHEVRWTEKAPPLPPWLQVTE